MDYNETGKTTRKGKKVAEGNPRENESAFRQSVKSKLQCRTYNVGYKGIVINYRYKIYKKPGKVGDDLRQLSPELSCTINSREYQMEEFDSSDAIPSSETQYIRVVCNQYLYEVAYKKHQGTRTYTSSDGLSTAKRSYQYTEITKLNVLVADHADVKNGSLPYGVAENTQRISPSERDGIYQYTVKKIGDA